MEARADFKPVTRQEFEAFVASYPRKLERSVSAFCEPPLISLNDFERAPYWPDSVVASYSADGQEGRNYAVLSDIDAPVPDDGKRDTDKPLTDRNGVVLVEGDRVDARWGASLVNGKWVPRIQRETIVIRDKGTKYEAYSFESCHNRARGFDMVKV